MGFLAGGGGGGGTEEIRDIFQSRSALRTCGSVVTGQCFLEKRSLGFFVFVFDSFLFSSSLES